MKQNIIPIIQDKTIFVNNHHIDAKLLLYCWIIRKNNMILIKTIRNIDFVVLLFLLQHCSNIVVTVLRFCSNIAPFNQTIEFHQVPRVFVFHLPSYTLGLVGQCLWVWVVWDHGYT
jgi:hypothetical protein